MKKMVFTGTDNVNHAMPKQIGDYNKNQMLSILREKGLTSRGELSRLLGISPTAVTKNTVKLIQNGIVRECGAEQSNMGRKPILMELCGDFCYVLGADIVGGAIKVALADFMGRIVNYYEESVKQIKSGPAVLEQLIAALQSIITESGVPKDRIWAAIIGTSGVFDPGAGKSRFAYFLKDWEDIDIRKKVFDSISIETYIENDAKLDLIGERWKGACKEFDSILYVKLGQGLTTRFILEKKLISGEHNTAGEIGYMLPGISYKGGDNYEDILCNSAICRKYTELGGSGKANTISDIYTHASNGDGTARGVISYLLDKFAVVLLNMVAVLDPEVIILGGDAACFGERETALLKQYIEQRLPLVQNIIPSKLRKNACLYGAIKMGLDHVEERITNVW